MSITLNTKVYDYQGFTPGNATLYKETSAGVPAGFSLLTARNTSAIGKDGREVVKWYLKLPLVATESTSCSCIGELLGEPDTVEITIKMDPSRSPAQRTDLRTRITNLTATAEFIASVQTLKQPTA